MRKVFTLLVFSFSLLVCHAQTWQWGQQGFPYAGNGSVALGVTMDGKNNVYYCGTMSDTIAFGPFIIPAATFSNDFYITKYDPNGNILWAQGPGFRPYTNATIGGIAADKMGNLYAIGGAGDTISFGPYTLIDTSLHGFMFFTKYDPSGNVTWAKEINGTGAIEFTIIDINTAGEPIIAGMFNTGLKLGTTSLTTPGQSMFISKCDSMGNIIWARQSGTCINSSPQSICHDKWGNIYITGSFIDSISFGSLIIKDVGPGSPSFILKLDADGNFKWIKEMKGNCVSLDLASDNAGNVYVSGQFVDGVYLGSYSLYASQYDAFLAKYDSTGKVVWALQGNQITMMDWKGLSVCADTVGHVYTQVWGTCNSQLGTVAFGNDTFNFNIASPIDPEIIIEFDTSGRAICGNITATQAAQNSLKCDPTGNYIYGAGELVCPVTYNTTVLDSNNGLGPVIGRWIACSSSPEGVIEVQPKEDCNSLFIPDAFSPNNDGQNDIFYVRGNCIATMDISIYDRWGNKVFESRNQATGWDGTYNGKPMNTGTYMYSLKGTQFDGTLLDKRGSITLVR
jgi:gliding motility-associated-like protein